MNPCRLGYEEHDGARYCHEHGDFVEAGDWYSGRHTCPKYRENRVGT